MSLLFQKNVTKVTLGRWNVEKCYKTINRKIDLSNTDHCGSCGINK
jgi:hypothetical protein